MSKISVNNDAQLLQSATNRPIENCTMHYECNNVYYNYAVIFKKSCLDHVVYESGGDDFSALKDVLNRQQTGREAPCKLRTYI